MTKRGQIRPFANAAMMYYGHGWFPLPVRAGSKRIAVDGFTGHDGAWPGLDDIGSWIEEMPDANIALRMPETVIGIDVDAYDGRNGAATLAKLEDDLAPLPKTFITTSRTDGVSGIRLYTVPPGITWRGKAGNGIDVISWHYRYAIVNPSVHPETHERYHWRRNSHGIVMPHDVKPERLPELPEEWISHLRHDGTNGRGEFIPSARIRRWVQDISGDGFCEAMEHSVQLWRGRIHDGGEEGGAHDEMIQGVNAVVGDAANGHKGLAQAFRELWSAFATAVHERRDVNEMESEFARAVHGSVRNHYGRRVPESCPCAEWENSGDSFRPHRPSSRTALSEVQPSAIEWLHYPVFPAGVITMMDGDPKYGKSLITIKIAAAATRGKPVMPFGTSSLRGPVDVFFITSEDRPDRAIVPRLIAAGADLNRVFIEKVRKNQHGMPIGMTLPNSAPRIRALVEGCAFCIVDPITNFLDESIQTGIDASVRRALDPLSWVANETNTCFILVRHLRKASGTAMERGVGSMAFNAIARSGMIAGAMPDGRYGIAHSYANYAREMDGAFSYSIETTDGDVPFIEWGEHCREVHANDLVGSIRGRGRPQSDAREQLSEFLREAFTENDTITTAELKAAGITWTSNMLRRVMTELGAKHMTVRNEDGTVKGAAWTVRTRKIALD